MLCQAHIQVPGVFKEQNRKTPTLLLTGLRSEQGNGTIAESGMYFKTTGSGGAGASGVVSVEDSQDEECRVPAWAGELRQSLGTRGCCVLRTARGLWAAQFGAMRG